jgi:hypothetical protein
VKLKAIYEQKDQIPAGFEELYSEKNGKFELTGVEGVKTQGDIDRLNGALVSERKEHDATRAKLRSFGDLTPEAIQALVDERDELKIRAGNASEDKINELVEKRIAVRLRPVEKERDDLKTRAQTLEQQIAEATGRETRRSLVDTIRAEASGEKALPVREGALGDIELIAPMVFEMVDGKHVTREGNPLGVDPGLDPRAFLETVMTSGKRPNWFKDSQGAGAGGGGHGTPSGKNPFSTENWNLTEIGQIVSKNPAQALRLARASKDPRAATFVRQLSTSR